MADEELKVVLVMDDDGFLRSTKRVNAAMLGMEKAHHQAQSKVKSWKGIFADADQDFSNFSSKVSGVFSAAMGPITAFTGAVAAVGAGLIGLGVVASQKAASFEALTQALTAVEGSASKAAASMAELKEIAKGPGLGVREAIETYMGLKRGGVDHDLSMRLTKELGNAVARGGGGKEMLGRAGLALGQIATKPFLQGEELNQLTEAGIPAYKTVKDIYGTTDTEELKRRGIGSAQILKDLATAMEKLERVGGGTQNTFDNLTDEIEQDLVSMGTSINGTLTPVLNDITNALTGMRESGVFADLGDRLITNIMDSLGAASAEEALDNLIVYIDTASTALRNLALNASDLFNAGSNEWDKAKDLADPFGWFHDTRKKGDESTGLPGESEARQNQSDREFAAEAKRKRKAAGKGSSPFEGTHWDPKQGKRVPDVAGDGHKAALDAKDSGKPGDEKTAQITPTISLLQKIADNTRKSAEIMDRMIGGGAVAHAFWNPVNIGRLNGGMSPVEHARNGNYASIRG